MKTSIILLSTVTIFILTSCRKDGNDGPPQEQGFFAFNRLLVEQTTYGGAGPYISYNLFIANPIEQTITHITDSTLSKFLIYHYDDNGRLVKIVASGLNQTDPTSRDSIIITRPTPNTVQWEYSEDLQAPVKTATITDLGGNRKQIVLTSALQDPAVSFEKLFINERGQLDSMSIQHSVNPGELRFVKRKLSYNSNGKVLSMQHSDWLSSSPTIDVKTTTFTKDNTNNEYLLSFLDVLTGSDLTWMSAYPVTAPTILFSYVITDKLILSKGTVTSCTATLNSQTIFSEFPVQYDNQGRIVTWSEIKNGTRALDVSITYYD
jgi:hypothetical protein